MRNPKKKDGGKQNGKGGREGLALLGSLAILSAAGCGAAQDPLCDPSYAGLDAFEVSVLAMEADSASGTGSAGTPESTSGPTSESRPEIMLVMVGDILLHTRVAESGRLEEEGYDFSAIFDGMRGEITEAVDMLERQQVISDLQRAEGVFGDAH